MALGPRQRWFVLGSLLAATLAAAWWLESGGEVAAPVAATARGDRRPPPPASAAGAPALLELDRLKRQPRPGRPEDAFARRSWYVPPPPPKALPPAPPAPPPLPYSYMGRLVEEGGTTVFLTRQDRSFAVKVGDVLDGTWRVDEIDTGRVTLTYLPLDMQQTLATGGDR